jgi:tyrosyl-tRNA synthetase
MLQKKLAEELTRFVHGQTELDKALETTQKLFANTKGPASALSIEDLESIEGIVKSNYPVALLQSGVDALTWLTENKVFDSKGAARKMIQNGGVSINREKITDVQMTINREHLLHERFILVQVGKKNYYLVDCQ